MKHLMRLMIMFMVSIMLVLNFSTVFAIGKETIQSSHYWRICNASWQKSEFNLPSGAPNVQVTATWAYNFDTDVTSYTWVVSNATKVSLSIYGVLALPTVKVYGYSYTPSAYKEGTCYYTYLPIGSEPMGSGLETE